MKLGDIETHLAAALRTVLGEAASVRCGPPVTRSVTGMKAEVFIHGARFLDLGGITDDGARVARRPLKVGAGLRGMAEERPARIEVEVTCIGPSYTSVQDLSATATPSLLTALQTLPPPLLAGQTDSDSVALQFKEFVAFPHSLSSRARENPCAVWYESSMVFRLDGFLHLRVVHPDGSTLAVSVAYDPAGADLVGEHVLLSNGTPLAISLTGHVLMDGARRPHRYVFPAFTLAPGASVKLWSGRGSNDGANLYWGRRRAVWNNTGDTLRLLNPQGAELVHLAFAPPPGGSGSGSASSLG